MTMCMMRNEDNDSEYEEVEDKDISMRRKMMMTGMSRMKVV